jgi:hypothetical protein
MALASGGSTANTQFASWLINPSNPSKVLWCIAQNVDSILFAIPNDALHIGLFKRV